MSSAEDSNSLFWELGWLPFSGSSMAEAPSPVSEDELTEWERALGREINFNQIL